MNRPSLPLGLSFAIVLPALGLGAPGCVTNALEPYAIADWQVRCDSEMGSCAVPPRRSVTGENGEDGNTISCFVNETDTDRTVTFTLGNNDAISGQRFELRVNSARVPRAGGSAGGGTCTVSVLEGANTYTGTCGGAAPSVDQPCQLSITFDVDTDSDTDRANVSLLCDHLPNAASGDQLRSLGSPTAGTPAALAIHSCVGLTRD